MSFTRKVASLVGIDVDAHDVKRPSDFPPDAYFETPAGTREFIQEILPTVAGVKRYSLSLIPFVNWIHHYNLTWLIGDLVAGVTVGFVAVPQGMAYALLAKLPVEYGLYTSFVGFILYWAFATSKDITIGVSVPPNSHLHVFEQWLLTSTRLWLSCLLLSEMSSPGCRTSTLKSPQRRLLGLSPSFPERSSSSSA
jgi:hypothetical protein